MNRLLLLRHARAAWAAPGMPDHDRSLDLAGRAECAALAALLLARSLLPDRVVCSTARRAVQTWEELAGQIAVGSGGLTLSRDLYEGDGRRYLDVIEENGAWETLLLVGHNPMMEDVAHALAPSGEDAAVAARARGFPTCALAVIAFPGPLAEAGPGKGRLEAFLTPRDGATIHRPS